MITRILTVVLIGISIAMLGYLYNSIDTVIKTKKEITTKELATTNALKLIREAEIVYLSVNGKYTSSWDSLRNFIINGRVPILDRHEKITQQAYGGEKIEIIIDTVGFITAKERIFKKNFTLNAGNEGIFRGYKVKEGDNVLKTQRAFTIDVAGKESEQPFIEDGVIAKLEPVKPGDKVLKGQTLVSYYNYAFDINTDLSKLGFKPGSDIKFDIFVGIIDKSGVKVQVIEVKDPSPDNPMRKESNEQKPRKPLRFGSRLDVSTAGNWE
jgi:hypothetical protein